MFGSNMLIKKGQFNFVSLSMAQQQEEVVFSIIIVNYTYLLRKDPLEFAQIMLLCLYSIHKVALISFCHLIWSKTNRTNIY